MARIKNNSYKHSENHIINHVRISNPNGDGYDITEVFQSMSLKEDILQGFIRGYILVIDTENYFDNLGLYGGDIVKINFTSRDQNGREIEAGFNKTFNISNYSRIPDKENSNRWLVRIDLISYSEYNDEKYKLSKSFTNTSSSQFVEYCLDLLEYEDDRRIEDTLHTRDFIVPNISPLQMIEFFTRNSQSKENGSGDYYFFENGDGINFITSHTLINDDPVARLFKKPTTDITDYNIITNYERYKGYDIPDQYRYGGFGMKVISSDLLNKNYVHDQYSVSDVKSNVGYMNSDLYPTEQEQTYNHLQFYPMNGFYENINLSQIGHFAPQRTIGKTLLTARMANLSVAGNIDIRAGKIIELTVPQKDGSVNQNESGKAIVMSVIHNVTRKTYTQDIKIASDSVKL